MSNDEALNVDDPQYKITPVQQAAASCTGAILTSLLVTPLDVVKIRLQTQQKHMNRCFLYCNGLMDHICGCAPDSNQKQWFQRPGHFNGTIDAFVKITKNEGLYSLWSGLSTTLVLAIPTTVLYFVSYEQLRNKLRKMYLKPEDVYNNNAKVPHWIPLISGATARVLAVTVVSPLELVRTKMQSKRISYAEIRQSLRFLVEQSGIFGLWKGVVPTLYRDVPFSAIYWMSYESLKSMMSTGTPTLSQSFVSGAISGGLAAMLTVPFDVVKTHQQIDLGEKTLYGDKPLKTKNTITVIKELYQRNGMKGLYAGLVPRLIKVAPACAIMISSFEYGKVFFYRHNKFMFLYGHTLNEIRDFYSDDYFPPDSGI